MDLSAMHVAVRSVVRDGTEVGSMPGVEGLVLKDWQRRVKASCGEITRIMPAAAAREWTLAPEPMMTK